jgi:membrane fusion protein, multidrug efflux system
MGVLAASVVAASCGGGEAKQPAVAEETPVVLSSDDVVVARKEAVGLGVVVTGSLNPYRIAEIRAQVPGIVTGMRVDRGDAVRAGQTLAVLQADGIRSQAAGAQANVAAAEANLLVARRQAESAQKLFEAGAMSEIEYRGAQAAYQAAEAQLAAAKAQATAASESARHATITAPFTGEVSNRQVNEGEAVNPGQPLFTVVNTEVLELAGKVPVERAAQVRPGLPVEFTLDAYPGRTFRGSVARVEPTADPATRQVGVYVQLPNKELGLVGGLFATGRILTDTQEEAIVVPTSAIRTGGGASYVWVVGDDGVVTRQDVTLGVRDEARGVVQVTSGLAGGERVIAAPGEIAAGTKVRIASGAAASAQSDAPEGR